MHGKTLELVSECGADPGRAIFHSFAFAKNGKSVARAGVKFAEVIQLADGKMLGFKKNSRQVGWSTAAFSPDLKRIVVLREEFGSIYQLIGKR